MQSLWLNEDALACFLQFLAASICFSYGYSLLATFYKLIINQPVRGLYFGILGLIFVLLGKKFGFGLPDNRVMCITKDHEGFMWFGTWAGTAKISFRYIIATKEGAVWLLTMNHGVFCMRSNGTAAPVYYIKNRTTIIGEQTTGKK